MSGPKRKPHFKHKDRDKAKAKAKKKETSEPPPRFAPSAFLSGSPEAVQALCDELADLASKRFSDLTGTTWTQVGHSLVGQLRAIGHDLSCFDEREDLQEWDASWHLPRGTFSLFLT